MLAIRDSVGVRNVTKRWIAAGGSLTKRFVSASSSGRLSGGEKFAIHLFILHKEVLHPALA
jgi:hypothetical protein